MSSWYRVLVATGMAAVGLCIAGCVNTSSYHTAEPVESGTTEVAVGLEGQMTPGDDAIDGMVVTQPRLNVRRGLPGAMDFGLTAGVFGFGADINRRIYSEDAVSVSVSPYMGLGWARGYGEDYDDYDAQLRWTTIAGVHFDYAAADNLVVTGALKPGFFYQRRTRVGLFTGAETDAQFNPLLGGSVGVKLDLEAVWLFPEINLMYAFVDDDDTFVPVFGSDEDLMVTFGLAFGF